MDSRVSQSHAHEYDEKYHHNQQVSHGEEDQHHDHEKKSVLKKVKEKAKKIKDKVTKHGHHDHEHGHYGDQHIPDDHDLDEEDDEDEEMVQDPEIHGAPIYDSATVKGVTPGQVQNIGRHGTNFGGSTVMTEPPQHEPRVVVVSPTTGIGQSRVNDPARTFVGENMRVHDKANLVRPIGLEKDPHAPRSTPFAHDPANYQTKATDPTETGGAEIDITPVQRSLAHMHIHNEPKPNLEQKVLPTISEIQHPLITESHHHQFVPEFSTATKTQYPSAQKHDHNMPHLSSEIKTQYPKSHDQLMPELHTSTKTHHPSTTTHDQNLPGLSSATKTHYPFSGSHDSGLFSTEPRNQYISGERHHDQDLSHMSGATKTQYPSVGSHDQFVPDWPTQSEPHYHSSGDHVQFMTDPIPVSTNTYSQTPEPTTTRFQEQPHYESMEKPSNESNYTDKISSATSAIADKAITAKNVVAAKLGYGEKDNEKETMFHEDNNRTVEKAPNQSSYTDKISSATSAVADKAVSAKNTVASKLGYGESDDSRNNKVTTTKDEEEKRDNADNSTTNTAAEYGKNVALSLADKLAPVYGKVAGAGSAVKSKLPGTEREESVGIEQDRGVSVKDYLVDKLRPSEEDKALSEVITESLHKKKEEPREVRDVKNVISDALHKREEEEVRPLGKVTESEEVKKRLGTDEKAERKYADIYASSPGTGVVDKLMSAVGSWFGDNPEENQSSQVAGGEDLSKNSGSRVEHVGERRLDESSH